MSKISKLSNHPQYNQEKDLLISLLNKSALDKKLWLLLNEMLTTSEVRMLVSRFMIGRFLKSGLSVREISRELGVSTTTVVRLAQVINQEGSLLNQLLDIIVKESPPQKRSDMEIREVPKVNKYFFGHE